MDRKRKAGVRAAQAARTARAALRVAERQLRESRHLFERFFQVSPELLCIARPDGSLVQVNPAFERVLGWNRDTLPGKPFDALLHPDDVSVFRAVSARLERGEAVNHVECRVLTAGGTYRWVEWNVSAERGGLVFNAGHEITERKEGEARLRQMITRLEAGNRELQELGYVAAQDLQEPLRRLRAALLALVLDLEDRGQTDSPQRANLRRAESAAGRLQALLGDLLTYSRVASAARQFEPVDLDAIIAEVLDNLQAQIAAARARIERTALPAISADVAQMRLLFNHLLTVILRDWHGTGAPLVRISANPVEPDAAGGPPLASIVVEVMGTSDNAPRRKLPHGAGGVPFTTPAAARTNLERPRTGPSRGRDMSGIGLAIVRRIVARHQGALVVHSNPASGTRFDVRLPVAMA